MMSATCYEHEPIIGTTPGRMTECEHELLVLCSELCTRVHAWCLLPNHYHLLVTTESIKELSAELGRFHGRSSYRWNLDDHQRGRHVWYRCFDRVIRNERHFWVTVNYIHNNPVHHGYVEKWQDWPWSSAAAFVERVGRAEVMRIWNEYPILDYGKGWDS
jgi:putative transposase